MSIALTTALYRLGRVLLYGSLSALATYWGQHVGDLQLPACLYESVGVVITAALVALDKFAREKKRGN